MPHILIVDDDELLRGTIADILVEEGHTVIEAQNGLEGLSVLERGEQIDVVLSDVRMPGMDGITFLHRVVEAYPTIPVVMLTGHGTVDSAVQAMREGAINYLLKPSNKKQILESVDDAIEQHRIKHERQKLLDQVVSGLSQLGLADSTTRGQIQQSLSSRQPTPHTEDRFLKIGDLTIDQHRLVALFKGRILELTPTEFDILYALVQAAGRVVTFEDIVFRLQGVRTERDEARSMISTHISNLRNKMRDAGCEHYLHNSRGHGYFVSLDSV
ncbi:MAG: response regulator transcription factor [Chloroflexi bacterium]|nr:response regulator transcription factor [Chloroflexota bacterium]